VLQVRPGVSPSLYSLAGLISSSDSIYLGVSIHLGDSIYLGASIHLSDRLRATVHLQRKKKLLAMAT